MVGRDHGDSISPLELVEKLAALAPLPRVHLVRYGGVWHPCHLREAIIPTRASRVWTARERGRKHLIGTGHGYRRVFDLDMATCPLCHRGSLRIIAATER